MNLDVVDKIQKLLALSKSANKHEAELALARAKEIAFKHELDLAQIESEKRVERAVVDKREGLPLSERKIAQDYIGTILVRHFRVKVVFTYKSLCLIGKTTDLEIAQYVNEFLIRETESLFTAFLASKGVRPAYSALYAPSWFYGMWEALDDKLAQLERDLLKGESQDRQANFALMIRNDKALIETKVKEFFPKLSSRESNYGKIDKESVIANGRQAGSRIDINKALSGSEASKQIS